MIITGNRKLRLFVRWNLAKLRRFNVSVTVSPFAACQKAFGFAIVYASDFLLMLYKYKYSCIL